MFLSEREITIGDESELIRVKAVGINRAECMHRMGKYPIKNEVEKYIGLEACGEVLDPLTKYKVVK